LIYFIPFVAINTLLFVPIPIAVIFDAFRVIIHFIQSFIFVIIGAQSGFSRERENKRKRGFSCLLPDT